MLVHTLLFVYYLMIVRWPLLFFSETQSLTNISEIALTIILTKPVRLRTRRVWKKKRRFLWLGRVVLYDLHVNLKPSHENLSCGYFIQTWAGWWRRSCRGRRSRSWRWTRRRVRATTQLRPSFCFCNFRIGCRVFIVLNYGTPCFSKEIS